jgi:uncharacterized protein YkwD
MKTPCFLALLAGLASLPLVSCGPQLTSQPVNFTAAGQTSADAVFRQVNVYRRSKGVSPLVRHPGLDRLAQQHSEFLRKNRGKFSLHGKNVSHDGFESRAAAARHQYKIMTLHENVAAGSRGTNLVQTWSNSRAHEHAMRGKWPLTGVGVVVDGDGMVFATQLFGTAPSSNSQMELRERFGMY